MHKAYRLKHWHDGTYIGVDFRGNYYFAWRKNMIKIKLAPELGGTYKSAQAIGNNVEIKQLSGAELKSIISSSVDSDEQLNFLRKVAKQFKAITITIDKKDN